MYQVTFQFENGDKPVVFLGVPEYHTARGRAERERRHRRALLRQRLMRQVPREDPQRRGRELSVEPYLRGRICRRLAA